MQDTEVLFSTCKSFGKNISAYLWDASSSNLLRTYSSGGQVVQKGACFIGNDFLLCADNEKPLINVWSLNKQEPIKKLNSILPGRVRALCLSKDNVHLAVAIDLCLYVWHISSGKLMAIVKKHLQSVNCVTFSNCGAFLLSGGEDGMLLAHAMSDLVVLPSYEHGVDVVPAEALYTKNDHSLAITDIAISTFRRKSRFITSSMDQTCKLYELETGNLLFNIVFEQAITVCTMDSVGWRLYVGLQSGLIRDFSTKSAPRSLEMHANDDEREFHNFIGHEKRVTCMSLNLLNSILASGAEDHIILMWDLQSKQILRRIEQTGPITNVAFILNYANFHAITVKSSICVKKLDRNCDVEVPYVISVIHEDKDIDVGKGSKHINQPPVVSTKQMKLENTYLRTQNAQLYKILMDYLK